MNLLTAGVRRDPEHLPFELVEFGPQILKDKRLSDTHNLCRWGLGGTPIRDEVRLEPQSYPFSVDRPFAHDVVTGLPFFSMSVGKFPSCGSRPDFKIDETQLYIIHVGFSRYSPADSMLTERFTHSLGRERGGLAFGVEDMWV